MSQRFDCSVKTAQDQLLSHTEKVTIKRLKKIAVIILKFEENGFTLHLKDADGMTNRVDPDQMLLASVLSERSVLYVQERKAL